MKINTVIFDLDGTLLYTLEDLTDSTNYALAALGYPKRSLEDIKNFVGNGVSLLIERALPKGTDSETQKKCLELFKKHYSDNISNKTRPYEGIYDLLKKLKKNGYNIIVVSNKFDSAVKKLCDKYFEGLITLSVGQQENIEPKPAPDMVLKAISTLNIPRENCIIIGDSEVDIQTASNSNIPCISVTWGYKSIDFLYKNNASTLIYSPEELLELI